MTRDSSSPQVASLALEQALNEALKQQQAGDFSTAGKLYQAILKVDPAHPKANHNMGVLAVQLKQPADGLPYFAAALDADPAHGQYWLSYIDALFLAGQTGEARDILALACSQGLAGDEVDALAQRLNGTVELAEQLSVEKQDFLGENLPVESIDLSERKQSTSRSAKLKNQAVSSREQGKSTPSSKEIRSLFALLDVGRAAEAVSLAHKLTLRFPRHGIVWKMLGVAFNHIGRHADALAPMQRAAELLPGDVEAHSNLGITLHALGRLKEAVASYQHALRLKGNDVGLCCNLGRALNALGLPAEAETYYRQALRIEPNTPDIHSNLGAVLFDLGRLKDAEASCVRAIQIDPDRAGAHNNLGLIQHALGHMDEAVASYSRAIQIDPDYALAHSNLGIVLEALGKKNEAEASYRSALAKDPGSVVLYSNLLHNLSLNPKVSAETLFAEHCKFGVQFESTLRDKERRYANTKDPERSLQIGFVSGDLCNHAVASFLEPMLVHLSGYAQLSLHAYSTVLAEDEVSKKLREYFANWNQVGGLSDADLDKKIQADGIDILIDLAGHTPKNRLLVFARKPAPIQVSWIGYPATTGLAAMDYFLADVFFLPHDRFAWQFTEKIVYLPTTAPFIPAEESPKVNQLPALSNGYVTFGSFNRPNKISRDVVALWSRLLRAVPDSRMLIGAMPLEDRNDVLKGWFADEGIARERLDFHKRCNLADYLALHHQVDICLDTFPYNGGTTTSHALWMGVPTLTLAGETPPSWVGVALLGFVGLTDFIARDESDFVARGVSLAAEVESLASVRAVLRARFENSPMGRPALIADAFQRAMRIMWLRWCAGLPPASFEVGEQDLEGAKPDAIQ